MTGSAHPRADRQRGAVLIVVLWCAGLVAALLLAALGTGRTDALVARNAVDQARAQLAAEGAAQLALARLLIRRAEGRPSASGDPEPWSDGDIAGRVAVIDENGRVDINEASFEMLAGLVQAVGRGEAEASALACAILGFRGAIDSRCAAVSSIQAGQVFAATAQLAALPGADPALVAALVPHVTVHSGAFGIDPAAATREALLAVPGHSPGIVAQFLLRRAARVPLGEGGSVYDVLPPSRYLTASPGVVFVIHVEAVVPGGAAYRVEHVVRIGGGDDRPYRTLAWRAQPPPRFAAQSAR
jgi:general secretion pathway protein K